MKKIARWTGKYPLAYAIKFVLIYFTWFHLLEVNVSPRIILHSRIDDMIPFCKYFVIPYYMWFAFIAGFTAYFLFKSPKDYQNVTRYMFTGMILALTIYTILPNGLDLRPQLTDTDLFTHIITMLYRSDTPTNVCPSLHVYNSLAMTAVICRSEAFGRNRKVKIFAIILCIFIILSTLFIKQHSIIDVFFGAVMALVLYPLAKRSYIISDDEEDIAREGLKEQ